MRSQDQVSRLLAIVPMVQAQELTIAELAETFQVSPKQILADLEILFMCGLPGGYPDDLIEIDLDAARDIGVVRLSNADYLTRPMRLTPDEVTFLQVALLVLLELSGEQQAQAAHSALQKLTELASRSAAERPSVQILLATGSEAIRSQLLELINTDQRIQLVYDRADGSTTEPLLDPSHIELRDGVAYLQAWSVDRAAWRTYRLDRINSVSAVGTRREAHGPAPDLSGAWFADQRQSVTLSLRPEAAWVADYYPSVHSESRGDELIVELPVTDVAWLRSLLLRLGTQADVVADRSVNEIALDAAQSALAHYAH